jgi:hypothetical protein
MSAPASTKYLTVAAATFTFFSKDVGSSDSKSSGKGLFISGLIEIAIKCRCLHPRNLFAAIAANIN